MRIINSEFTISCVSPKQYPQDDLNEIVLVGKSNVGKSSFINAICNRKNMAHTSSEPGKTRLINFYKITSLLNESDKKSFYFVDLPGYGFSKMSKSEILSSGKFIEEYLQKSSKIKLVIFLIDIRHDVSENDKLMYDYLVKYNVPFIVLCNKADKLAPTKVIPQVEHLQESLNPLKDIEFYPFSTEKRNYDNEILQKIEPLI